MVHSQKLNAQIFYELLWVLNLRMISSKELAYYLVNKTHNGLN